MTKALAALGILLGVAALAIGLTLLARDDPSAAPPSPAVSREDPPDFSFALIGDLPYRPEQEAGMAAIVQEINADPEVAFTIHDGDIKGGGQPCDDAVYTREASRFSRFEKPLVYTPGDNEWTDCFRRDAGGYDPQERLAHLRRTFFGNPSQSQGRSPLRLDFQSASYPENTRWHHGGITFATLHVVGSNNNRPSSGAPGGDEREFRARNSANLQWLRSTFSTAAAMRSAGVVVVMQANIVEADVLHPSGFGELAAQLRSQVREFGRPVVLVHGDTHLFRVDEPPLGGPPLQNLTRVETIGDPDVGWVKATVNRSAEEMFAFEPRRP